MKENKKLNYAQSLTNEPINNRFDNSFQLISYAIDIAQDMIHAGRQLHINPQVQNQAYQILEEIAEGKDLLEPIRIQRAEETQVIATSERKPGE